MRATRRDLEAFEEVTVETVFAPREFDAAFARRARGVRRRVEASWLLRGLVLGALASTPSAALAWYTRHGALRVWSLGWLAIGAVAIFVFARRRRWDDTDVALFLDEKLASEEVIVTAVGLPERSSPPARAIVRAASVALSRPLPKGSGPQVFRVWHLLAPVACAATVWVARLELPSIPAALPPPPGAETIALENLEGLEEARALAKVAPKDAAERERLRALSERAEKLKEQLAKGMPRREAQAELAKLREDVASERQRQGAAEERRGLEAALAKLSNQAEFDAARRALGDRDLTEFDDAMEELANRLERGDRERAAKALEDAAEAARREGAQGLASALEEQKQRLLERGKGAEALRELAKSLGGGLSPEGRRALDAMKQRGTAKDRAELGRELATALEGLTETERENLARRMKELAKQLAKGDNPSGRDMSGDAGDLEKLEKELATEEGQRRLVERLKELAREPTPSRDVDRERALGEAEKRLAEGESRLQQPSLVPLPSQGPGAPGAGPGHDSGALAGSGSDASPGRGGNQAQHGGETASVDAEGVRARAGGKLNAGTPNPGSLLGRTTGRAGETARTGGAGRLGDVGASELSGVERSAIPKEYRQQVGRYFPAR